MRLWTPHTVQAKNAHRELLVREANERFEWFRRRLKDMDENLDLVSSLERVDEPGFRPGYWHVRRRNDGAPDSYMPICGRDGEFMEPSECHLNEIAARDMWRDPKLVSKVMEAEERAKQKEKAARDDEQNERLREIVAAHGKTQIVVP